MADLNNNNNERNKSINVTKPKSQAPSSNIDASRVSAYTLREQQSLERLKKKVGNLDQKENRTSHIKTIVAIILVIILIILAVVFILFITRTNKTVVEDYDMRLSMQLENKSSLSIITETGMEQLREINPGDRIPLRARVMNSSDIDGDKLEEGVNPPPIYVRFRLVLILDYEERYDILKPTMPTRPTSEIWYKYTEEDADSSVDDHYYYYVGALSYMQEEYMFTDLLFDGNVITIEDGGKYGQIQVHVESVEANIAGIINGEVWPSAPTGWVQRMIRDWNNTGGDYND